LELKVRQPEANKPKPISLLITTPPKKLKSKITNFLVGYRLFLTSSPRIANIAQSKRWSKCFPQLISTHSLKTSRKKFAHLMMLNRFGCSHSHTCRSRNIFGGAKDLCPNFTKLARKVVVRLPLQISLTKIKTMKLFWVWKKVFVCVLAPSHVWRHLFQAQCYVRCISRISSVFHKRVETPVPEFSRIFPGFSTNQNFWRCACTSYIPASYTTSHSHLL